MDARSPSFSCSGERRSGAAWSAVIGRRLLPGPRPWGVCYLNDGAKAGAKAGPAPVACASTPRTTAWGEAGLG